MADGGPRRRGAHPPDRRHRRRLEIVERGRARHAAGNADHLRRPAAPPRPVALSRWQGDPLAPDPRCAAPHQGRRRGQDRDRWHMVGRHARGLRRPDRSDPLTAYPRLCRDQAGAEGLFARRPRKAERQSRRRRSLRRALLDRPVLHLAPLSAQRPRRERIAGGLDPHRRSTHPGPGLGGGSGFLAAKRLGA